MAIERSTARRYDDPTVPLDADGVRDANMHSSLFRDYAIPARTAQLEAELADRGTALDALLAGSVPYNVLEYTDQPTAGQTITVGDDVFEIIDPLADPLVVADDGNIAVLLGDDEHDTYDNLVAAGNAATAGNEHASVLLADEETKAVANGTNNLLWVRINGSVIVYQADAPGGTPTDGAATSLAFTDTADNAAWKYADLDESPGATVEPATKQFHGTLEVLAVHLTGTQPQLVQLPFAAQSWDVHVEDAAGVRRDRHVEVSVPAAVEGQNALALDLAPSAPTSLRRQEIKLRPVANTTQTFHWNPPAGVSVRSYKYVRGATVTAGTLTAALDRITKATGAVESALSTAVDIAAGDNDVEPVYTPSVAAPHAVAATQGIAVRVAASNDYAGPNEVTLIAEYIEPAIATDVVHVSAYGA